MDGAETTTMGARESALILAAMEALRAGNLTVQLPDFEEGAPGEIARTFNEHVRMLNDFAVELTRVSRELGLEGRFGGQMEVDGLAGAWQDLADNVNTMAARLTVQIRALNRYARSAGSDGVLLGLTTEIHGETADLCQAVVTLAGQTAAR
jgi:hypothetical protein